MPPKPRGQYPKPPLPSVDEMVAAIPPGAQGPHPMEAKRPRSIESSNTMPQGHSQCPLYWVVDTCPGFGRNPHHFIHRESTCPGTHCIGDYHHELILATVPPNNSQQAPRQNDYFPVVKRLCWYCLVQEEIQRKINEDTDQFCIELRKLESNPALSEQEKAEKRTKLRNVVEAGVFSEVARQGAYGDEFGR